MRVTEAAGNKPLYAQSMPLEQILAFLEQSARALSATNPAQAEILDLLAHGLDKIRQSKADDICLELTTYLLFTAADEHREEIGSEMDTTDLSDVLHQAAVWMLQSQPGKLSNDDTNLLNLITADTLTIFKLGDNFNAMAAHETESAAKALYAQIGNIAVNIGYEVATPEQVEQMADDLLTGFTTVTEQYIDFLTNARQLCHWVLAHRDNLTPKAVNDLCVMEYRSTPVLRFQGY